jgi:multicomponent Na+:H+ antiporter subunit B
VNGASRGWLFLISALGLGAFFLWGLLGLPALGNYQGPYGDIINSVAVGERHVTNTVTAVNFDYRGTDTIGEEFILFVSVAGCALLLRQQRNEERSEEEEVHASEGVIRGTSAGVKTPALLLAIPCALFGWYVIAHGQLTPGGGFQGGVIAASAAVFVYLAGEYLAFRTMNPSPLLELLDSAGAGGYVVVGLSGLAAGVAFMQNVLPLGPVGQVWSAGTIWAISITVGLEVSAALVLLMLEFLEQTLEIRQREPA